MEMRFGWHNVKMFYILFFDFIQRFLTNSLSKFFKWDEAALLTVKDGVPELDQAVPLVDPVQVGAWHLVTVRDGTDDSAGNVSQTVTEMSLM